MNRLRLIVLGSLGGHYRTGPHFVAPSAIEEHSRPHFRGRLPTRLGPEFRKRR